jgi:quercetin dioxygenase-like cupin family protein
MRTRLTAVEIFALTGQAPSPPVQTTAAPPPGQTARPGVESARLDPDAPAEDPMRHSEPVYAEITPELRERLEKFREEHARDRLGKVADTILFEDDNVRIWEMKLEPGQHSDLHHHEHEYYLVIFSGDLVAGVCPKGGPIDMFVGVVPPQGNTVRVPKGGTEWAVNVGKKTYHEILIELKKS